ncbi:DUF4259 domain-containing protein [Kitasatospora sp. GAS1066B]|uniref:DUF4259 domain-containing protein n=1 Tax=Kitasatospora sp. GAS1066B TaxID=3156271 RepID=UPI003513A73B
MGPFDSDHAGEFATEVDTAPAQDRAAVIRGRLARVTSGPPLVDSCEGDEAVAAAALVAAQCPGGTPVTSGHRPRKPIPALPPELRPLAAKALDRVLADAQGRVDSWTDAVDLGERWLSSVVRLRMVLDPESRPVVAYTPRPVKLKATDVGTRMVHQTLGVDHIRSLPGTDDGGPLGELLEQLARTAVRMDHVQDNLVSLARMIQRDMQAVIDGRDVDQPQTRGVVGSAALSLDLLVARRAELHERLTGLTETYRSLSTWTAAAQPAAPAPAEKASANKAPDNPVTLTSTQEKALAAIATGNVLLHEGGRLGAWIVHAPRGVRITNATLNALFSKELANRDTSTSLYVGQKIYLTPDGHERHAALSASTRASAARTRSTQAPSGPGTQEELAVVSATPVLSQAVERSAR